MFKNQKGITLIALVITIIVLLILAGITIALITSNDSAPQKAGESKIMQDVGAAKDLVALNATKLVTDYYNQKYVATSNNADDNNATILAYFTANTVDSTAATTDKPISGLFKDLASNITAEGVNTDGSITLTSNETVSKNGKAYKYVQNGTIGTNGGITWANPTASGSDVSNTTAGYTTGDGWVQQ